MEKQGDLRPKLIQMGKGDGSPGSGVFMLGTPPGTCPECAVDHKPEEMHDRRSLPYQYQFLNKTGRWPTWDDALAHCSPEYKKVAEEFLREKGLWVTSVKPGPKNKAEQTAEILMDVKRVSKKKIAEPGNIFKVKTVSIKEEPKGVKVGQTWKDTDPRLEARREIVILAIKGQKATVQRKDGSGPKTKVSLTRFKPGSTGYELVQDV